MQEDCKDSIDGKPSIDRNGSVYADPEKAGHVEETARRSSKYDTGDPFGDETDAEVKYRTLEWWQASMIMIAETISLGILSLPSVLGSIGMVPGVILILGLGIVATYTGYIFGQFKNAYPHVHNMADAGEVLMGRFGKELFGAAQVIFLIFTMGSHILTFTIAFNAITGHAACTIVWGVIGTIVLFLFTIPRTLKNIAHFSIVSAISIVAAVVITMVGVGIERPDPNVQATTKVAFAPAFLSVTNIIFAFAGHLAFFSFISEMKKPQDFPKALILLQATDIGLYLIAAIVIYRYAGPEVASPALGSTNDTVKRVAYGIALPTIVIAGVIYAHVAAKYIYVRIFRGTKHMSSRSWLAVGSWLGIIGTLWIVAFIIAESIPTFNDLLGLISSLFASWFTYGIAGSMWLFLNYGQWFKNWRKISLFVLNIMIFCLGATICGVGLYASGKSIHDNAGSGASWSCADNSAPE
ncbi:amino acid transporter like protein [Zymoseptoria brevis]|uniref:Amino acid transporter like protein n=1 Tax=Zymoseptoria brevis TaxID=1047168 RepID=A0A0F4GRE8_9PEZI|nr:amino acid transporter like protein [Zymoseptoria brevis]